MEARKLRPIINDKVYTGKLPQGYSPYKTSHLTFTQCSKCGGETKDSKALLNSLVSSNDFGLDAGNHGTTQSRVGKAKLVECKKCKSCGHSFIPELSESLKWWNGLTPYNRFILADTHYNKISPLLTVREIQYLFETLNLTEL